MGFFFWHEGAESRRWLLGNKESTDTPQARWGKKLQNFNICWLVFYCLLPQILGLLKVSKDAPLRESGVYEYLQSLQCAEGSEDPGKTPCRFTRLKSCLRWGAFPVRVFWADYSHDMNLENNYTNTNHHITSTTFFSVFLGLHQWHTEVPRLGV